MTPGELIKHHRNKLGMTQLQLAEELNYKIPQFVSLMENEHSKMPLSIAAKVCNTLNIPTYKMKLALINEYEQELKKALKIKE